MLLILSVGLVRKVFNMKYNNIKVGATVRHLDDGAIGQVIRIDLGKANENYFYVSWVDNPDWHNTKQITLIN